MKYRVRRASALFILLIPIILMFSGCIGQEPETPGIVTVTESVIITEIEPTTLPYTTIIERITITQSVTSPPQVYTTVVTTTSYEQVPITTTVKGIVYTITSTQKSVETTTLTQPITETITKTTSITAITRNGIVILDFTSKKVVGEVSVGMLLGISLFLGLVLWRRRTR